MVAIIWPYQCSGKGKLSAQHGRNWLSTCLFSARICYVLGMFVSYHHYGGHTWNLRAPPYQYHNEVRLVAAMAADESLNSGRHSHFDAP